MKPAKERLLAAATRVFARDGLDGATTRVIAQEAGVNEVTLFRIFGSKKKLLAEVVAHSFIEEAGSVTTLPVTTDLRSDLVAFAKLYERQIVENLALIRTLIGDLQRHQEHEVQVLRGIFQSLRAQMIARVVSAQKQGRVRSGVDPAIAVDQLTGMLFSFLLKKGATATREYSEPDYIKACIDLVFRGLAKAVRK